jgi:asparagine synthase (glutamine-hydrolysing)
MASARTFSLPLTALDVASGIPLGAISPAHAPDGTPRDVRAALEAAMRPALQRPPCFVAFSGGRDSSAMLAVADRLADREGLPRPIALTARFPGAPATDESDWQERAIAALGIETWERLTLRTEDVEGIAPPVQRALQHHGPLYPANFGLFLALFDHAGAGSLITGLGGDELLGAWRHRGPADVLAGRRSLRAGRLRSLVRPLVPRPLLRRRAARAPSRHGVDPTPWLAPAAARTHARALAAELADEPHAWSARVRWKARRRRLALTRESVAQIAADSGTRVVHPLLDPATVEALASAGGRLGYGARHAVMEALFGDLLPLELLTRGTKAHFQEVFWGPATRAYARRLLDEGELAVPALLDREGLAATWTSEWPPGVTLLLLQASWLTTQGLLPREWLSAA